MIIDGHQVYIRPGFKPAQGWAIFLDRDGVINREVRLLQSIKDIELIPEIIPALAKLNRANIPVIVVHNAAVVARNLCSLAQLEKINYHMIHLLKLKGVYVDAIFYCPHHFDAYNPVFKKACSWRKPGPGMLLAAAKQFNLNLIKSYLIGDQARDIEAAQAVGMTAFLVSGGQKILTAIDKIIL
ncbi:MAG: HAD family hydrolase [Patescibacteria group bacterium]